MGHRVIATVDDYHGFVAALRTRIAELGTTCTAVDELAGIPDGYLSKCLVPTKDIDPMLTARAFGRHSLGPILGALGLKLAVIVDEEATAKIRPRLAPSRWPAKRRAAQAEIFAVSGRWSRAGTPRTAGTT
jgi:hypothetical protein